ncbi:hypothetical protein EIN_429680 [Entamoeba invadens IP1]|uniref:Ubiquitin-like domain-containing protein n=1 Tax=Entamoeba invadens IP1 TaxID=370355 RepID=A0A0A1UHE7_ENTIV|nr:hypothetical protein EIN_429680 [Entamoeba invadens IP1]ELP95192.1 hypothetical protein EIN_429680 [Entamoeba invadens IP1]|eukprot:XP_004261963.1 hypothetical protein EIN_429680 [Entamoeba invadens IP1]
MKINVGGVSGGFELYEVPGDETVGYLKGLLSAKYHKDVSKICLVYKGEKLANEMVLSETIKDGDRVIYIEIRNVVVKKVKEHHKRNSCEMDRATEGNQDDILEVSFGDSSFEEMLDDIAEVDVEMAEAIRGNPDLISEILLQDTESVGDGESLEEEVELEKAKIEGDVLDKIHTKLHKGNPLNELEKSIINSDDGDGYEMCAVWKLIEMGYREDIAEEAVSNTSKFQDAVEYCEDYVN